MVVWLYTKNKGDTIKIMNFIENLRLVCSGALAKADAEEKEYLPLWMHMIDTAGIAGKLYDERLSKQEKGLFRSIIPDDEKIRNLFILMGGLHDIGKMSFAFQQMLLEKLPAYPGFKCLPSDLVIDRGENHHSLLGMYILKQNGFSERLASVVGSHHGKSQDTLNGSFEYLHFRGLYGDDETWWKKKWKKIIDVWIQMLDIQLSDYSKLKRNTLMILCGTIIQADWIASNTTYFPLLSFDEQESTEVYPERIEAGWKKLDLPIAWETFENEMNEENFKQMFGFFPNEVQKTLMDILSKATDPGIFVIEAQMGVGKTEAALMAADMLSRKYGSDGVFFGLPTQATANGLYPRFEEWSNYEAQGHTQSIMLAHGMASFNEDYANVPKGTANVDAEDGNSSLIVHEWMQGSRVKMLSDFVIGTVDQGLMMALGCRFVMLRHIGFTGKVVIIDEIHAYDAYMNIYFSRMLEWLGSYHVPVILLSATLPGARRKELIESYLKGKKKKTKIDSSIAELMSYPLISWSDGMSVHYDQVSLEEKNKEIYIQKIYVESREEENKEIIKLLEDRLDSGGCAGIVVNTVKEAQQLSIELNEKIKEKGFKIIDFHSRFTSTRRSEIEKEVLKLVGKYSTEIERKKVVIIGTQVIEQSLDVDFDMLVTELCPIDLLLQRIGRLHRHQRVRPDNLKKAICYCIVPKTEDENTYKKSVYADWLLYRTLQELRDEILIPKDIPTLVGKVYADPPVDRLTEKERKLWNDLEFKKKNSENKAKNYRINEPNSLLDSQFGLNKIMNVNMGLSEEQANASVRDIKPTFKCILVKQVNEHQVVPIDNKYHEMYLDINKELSYKEIKILMEEKVSLPLAIPYTPENIERFEKETAEKFPQWIKSKWLKNEFILMFDANNKFMIEGHQLEYSDENGLLIDVVLSK